MGKKQHHPTSRNTAPEMRKTIKGQGALAPPGRELRATAERMVRSNSTSDAKRRRQTTFGAPPTGTPNSERIGSARVALEAQQKRQEYEQRQRISEAHQQGSGEGADGIGTMCLRRFYQDFQHVVEVSDVLLEVLDARDPMACRLSLAEDTIKSQHGESKKIVLLLNKMDLVPIDTALQWLDYLRSSGETVIAFSTQQRGGNTETSDLTRRCIDNVFKVLRDFSRLQSGGHKSITVGVIGYPNVGKSSIINALKRKDVVGVANLPGSTRSTHEIDLRQGVKIVDCPGVIFDTSQARADLVLINAVKIADVADPVAIVGRIVEKVGVKRLTDHYRVASCTTLAQLLDAVAVRKGRLQGGGIADEEGTARCILKDWNDGLIAFYTTPPQLPSSLFAPPTVKRLTEEEGVEDDEVVLRTSLSDGIVPPSGPMAPVVYGVSDTVGQSRAKVMKRLRSLNK